VVARSRFVRGRNLTIWSVRLRVKLPRGRYVAIVRGVDTRGRRERLALRANTLAFRLR
jgi:hypothetical protein